jgi:hypothetical protein
MRPVEGAEEPPRPPNLMVVIEEQEARYDPNVVEVCRNVSNELQGHLTQVRRKKVLQFGIRCGGSQECSTHV